MAVQNNEGNEESFDTSKVNEQLHSISSQYREKYTDCGKYLNELRLLKQDLLEKETILMLNVESSYDRYIRQIKNQKEQCMSAISEEYSHRTNHLDKLIETLEQMQTQLSEYTVMTTSQDTFSDTESVGSAVFSDLESVSSEVTSPLCEPPRVERDMLSYNECNVVFGENGVKQGEFRNLRGLAVDYQNRIFVVDCGNKRVQVCLYNHIRQVRFIQLYRCSMRILNSCLSSAHWVVRMGSSCFHTALLLMGTRYTSQIQNVTIYRHSIYQVHSCIRRVSGEEAAYSLMHRVDLQ